MTNSAGQRAPGIPAWIAAGTVAMLSLAGAAVAEDAPAPLPPVSADRTVVADVASMILAIDGRERTLKDLDAEAAEVIAQINRSPSTWQSYLLYTQEDLPERLFHPGFTFTFGRPRERMTEAAELKPLAPAAGGEAGPAAEGAPGPEPGPDAAGGLPRN